MWSAFALAILGRLFGWVPFIAAYIAGKRAARAAAMEIAMKVKDAQAKIAARPAASAKEILDRLRRDGAL